MKASEINNNDFYIKWWLKMNNEDVKELKDFLRSQKNFYILTTKHLLLQLQTTVQQITVSTETSNQHYRDPKCVVFLKGYFIQSSSLSFLFRLNCEQKMKGRGNKHLRPSWQNSLHNYFTIKIYVSFRNTAIGQDWKLINRDLMQTSNRTVGS